MSRHPLFRHYPLQGVADTSIGSLPRPYHVYNGHGMLIGGTADLDGVTALLQQEAVTPLQTRGKRALMVIWVCDFTRASLDPHTELQISFLVTTGVMAPPVSDRRLGLLHALTTYPDVGMFCHGLWNNTEKVVIYNRELLGLPAELAESRIVREKGRKQFSFQDENGRSICRGNVGEAAGNSFGLTLEMLRLFGLRGLYQLAQKPILTARVINPRSNVIPTILRQDFRT